MNKRRKTIFLTSIIISIFPNPIIFISKDKSISFPLYNPKIESGEK